MAQASQNTSLSLPTRLLCAIGPPATILGIASSSPRAALVTPLVFAPPALLLYKWRQLNDRDPSQRGELEPMIWTYVLTGTLGLAAVATVQLGVGMAAIRLLFGTSDLREIYLKEVMRSTIEGITELDILQRKSLASSWQNWAFITLFSYVLAGFLEEGLKYLPIAYARRRGTPEERKPRNRAYIDYAIAAALGFAAAENIGAVYGAKNEEWPRLLRTLFERVVYGSFGHSLVATLTALRAIRRDYYEEKMSWWNVVGPSVFFHGTADFVLFAASSLQGNPGWIFPTGAWYNTGTFSLFTCVIGAAVWKVRQQWKLLKEHSARISGQKTDVKPAEGTLESQEK